MLSFWHSNPPRGLASDWLPSPGSLTARLQANGRFRVQSLGTGWSMATADEASRLGLRRRQRVYARHVCLHVDDRPCVVARTVVSRKALHSAWRSLRRLGSRPLGAALWVNPRIHRGAMEFAWLRRGQDLYQALARHQAEMPVAVPARRSCFFLKGQKLLVLEAFLPAINALGPGPLHVRLRR